MHHVTGMGFRSGDFRCFPGIRLVKAEVNDGHLVVESVTGFVSVHRGLIEAVVKV